MFERKSMFYLAVAVVGLALSPLLGSRVVMAGGEENRLRAELVAPAAAGDVSGKCDFRERDGRRQFSAEAEGFAAGYMLDVSVSGQVVGTITIGALGVGGIDFDDEQPNDEPPFPANFPTVHGGTSCVADTLSGSFQPK